MDDSIRNHFRLFFCAILLILLPACSDSGDNDRMPDPDGDNKASALDRELRSLLSSQDLTGDPRPANVPDISDPMAQLGMKLFFSKSLSGEFDTACASCHHPLLGGGDQLSLPVGTGALDSDLLGPGREHISGLPQVGRNSPTTFNSALYQENLFLDGRVSDIEGVGIVTPDSESPTVADPEAGSNLLAAQARFPVVVPNEMRSATFEHGADNDTVRAHLAARIGDYGIGAGEIADNRWLTEFRQAFESDLPADELITFSNITAAISVYQQSQSFVESPWKSYVQGDNGAISDEAKRGAILFFTEPPLSDVETSGEGAGCVICHSGDFFSNEEFEIVAVPQIGPGKGDPNDGDLGRARVMGEGTEYKFRNSSLLNIEVTGPYGHAGAYASLEEIVLHYSDTSGVIDEFFASSGWCQLPQYQNVGACASLYPNGLLNTASALVKVLEERNRGMGEGMPDVLLSEAEVQELVAFMLTLTDPCVLSSECLAPWIPARDAAPDGHQLNARIGEDSSI